jgi:signal transduction histidine kinase
MTPPHAPCYNRALTYQFHEVGAYAMTPATVTTTPAELCELLLKQSPGCAWLLRHDGTFHAAYGDVTRVFGRPAADLQNLRFSDLLSSPAHDAWIRRLERVFTGETVGGTGQFSESAPIFSITMFPVRPPEGEIALAGGIAHQLPDAVLRTLAALETDRERLARLLHDRVAQGLSAAGLQLDLLRMDLAESVLPVPQRIGEIQATLETIMELVRDVNRDLNPTVAERIGLRAALDALAGRLRADFKGNVRVFAAGVAQPAPDVAAALYRIAQEAAGRAARRAGCSAIEILLKSLRSGLALEIRDNGADVDAAHAGGERGGEGGMDLLTIQHFADRAGIELQIESAPGGGTVVRALCLVGQALPPANPVVPTAD